MTGEYIPRDLVLSVIEEVFRGTDPSGEEQFGILKCHRVVREHPAADVAPMLRRWCMVSGNLLVWMAVFGVLVVNDRLDTDGKPKTNTAETAEQRWTEESRKCYYYIQWDWRLLWAAS